MPDKTLLSLLQLLNFVAYSLQLVLSFQPGFNLFFSLLKHLLHFSLLTFQLAHSLANFTDLARQPGNLLLMQSPLLNRDLSMISTRPQTLDLYSELAHFAQYLLNDLLLIRLIEGRRRTGLRVTLLWCKQVETNDAKESPAILMFHCCHLLE